MGGSKSKPTPAPKTSPAAPFTSPTTAPVSSYSENIKLPSAASFNLRTTDFHSANPLNSTSTDSTSSIKVTTSESKVPVNVEFVSAPIKIEKVLFKSQNTQLPFELHQQQQQQTQSPSDISATQVVLFSANNYIIPNILIPNENSRPFSNIAYQRIKTDRFILHVCPKHKSKEGCDIKHCFRFHVCHKWIRNNCDDNNCSFPHHFQDAENECLYDKVRSRNFGEEELKERLRRNLFFKKYCKEDWSSCICMDFILKQCKRNVCDSIHLNLLYSWQFFHKSTWRQFSNSQNKEIEKCFCDPSKSFLTLNSQTLSDKHTSLSCTDSIFPNKTLKIDFKTMDLIISNELVFNVRRISTPSDVTVYKTVATRWLWYWNDNAGNWNFYTNAIVNDFVIHPFSDYIETQFLKKVKDFTFKLNEYDSCYTINFEEMTQTNQITLEKKDIRRRPMHSQDLRWKADKTFTSFWSNLTPKEEFLRQEVSTTSPEFYYIQNMIVNSLPVRDILIHRIENKFLWEAYQLKKAQMMLTYGNDLQTVNEQYMFHGTSNDVIDKICADNFDWRLYGTKVGNVYGKGTYFANSAKVSNCYASADVENYRWIFVALVLVGKATVGNSKMTIPPINPITNIRFDSTINDKECPKIFVKYNLDEYYPAYLVKLKTL